MEIWMGKAYVPLFKELLLQIFTGTSAEHLLYRGTSLSQETRASTFRGMFILRICENLCYLGLNIEDEMLREEIHHTLSSLMDLIKSGVGLSLDPLYGRYITARNWPSLLRTFLETLARKDSQETIQLVSVDHPSAKVFIPGARPVMYKSLSELSEQLKSETVYRCKAAVDYTFNPPSSKPSRPSVAPAHLQNTTMYEHGFTDHESTSISAVTTTMTNEGLATCSARKILQCYRTYKRRHAVQAERKQDIAMLRNQCFSDFLHAAAHIHWPAQRQLSLLERRYRLLYQGPLPHILVCLQHVRNYAHREKKAANKSLLAGNHLDLEIVEEQRRKISGVIRQAAQLHAMLEPFSEVHKKTNIRLLISNVEKVKNLIESLPIDISPLQQDFDLGTKAILVKRKKTVAPETESSC